MKHTIQRRPIVAVGMFSCAAVLVWCLVPGPATRSETSTLAATPTSGLSQFVALGETKLEVERRGASTECEAPSRSTPKLAASTVHAPARISDAGLDSAPCFDSILADQLDVAEVAAWAERFAAAAQVDPSSVEVDARTGNVKGALTTPDGAGAAKFTIRGSRYEVELWPPAVGATKSKLPLRSVRWSFVEELGAAAQPSLSLQHHPDTSRSASDFVADGAERAVGWTLGSSDRGASATPIVVRASQDEPGAWIIGRSELRPSADWPGYFIDGSHKLFLAKLSPHAAK